jgi:Uma2 family endonuclease
MTTAPALPLTQSKTLSADIVYPESDGLPMAETDTHIQSLIDARFTLKERYRADPHVYAAGNMLVYHEEGNPHASFAPDVFVVFGVPKHDRRIYKIWEEGKPPTVIFEITSASTKSDDLNRKRTLYEELGVREYFLFDPLSEYLRPPLRGFRLDKQGYYYALELKTLPNGGIELFSETLQLAVRVADQRLRLFDPKTNEYLRSTEEEAADRRRESEARRVAETRAQTLEAELARLQAELNRLKSNS